MLRRLFPFAAIATIALCASSAASQAPAGVPSVAAETTTTLPQLTSIAGPASVITEPPTTISAITGGATVDTLAISVRVSPPETRPPVDACDNPDGLHCLPFAPPGLDKCAEMNFYRIEFGLPDRFSDQPRIPAVRFAKQGIGWRESNCNNAAKAQTKAGRCCLGWWAVAISNRTAPGYRQGFIDCGVFAKWDYYGNSPLQKQKSACVAKVLYDVYLAHGSADPWRL